MVNMRKSGKVQYEIYDSTNGKMLHLQRLQILRVISLGNVAYRLKVEMNGGNVRLFSVPNNMVMSTLKILAARRRTGHRPRSEHCLCFYVKFVL